jgi:hypothetical protein
MDENCFYARNVELKTTSGNYRAAELGYKFMTKLKTISRSLCKYTVDIEARNMD